MGEESTWGQSLSYSMVACMAITSARRSRTPRGHDRPPARVDRHHEFFSAEVEPNARETAVTQLMRLTRSSPLTVRQQGTEIGGLDACAVPVGRSCSYVSLGPNERPWKRIRVPVAASQGRLTVCLHRHLLHCYLICTNSRCSTPPSRTAPRIVAARLSCSGAACLPRVALVMAGTGRILEASNASSCAEQIDGCATGIISEAAVPDNVAFLRATSGGCAGECYFRIHPCSPLRAPLRPVASGDAAPVDSQPRLRGGLGSLAV